MNLLPALMICFGCGCAVAIALLATRKRPAKYVPPAGDPVADRIRPHPGPVDWDTELEWVPAPHRGPGMYELREKRTDG